MLTTRAFMLGAAALALAAAVPHPAAQASVSYEGRQLTIVIGYSMGGTYGLHAQLMSEHLSRQLPGNPTMIVQSMPGAGGLKMLNHVANVMPRDGMHFFMPADSTIVSQLLRPDAVRFDAREFSWLGTADQTNVIWMVRTATGVKSWEDLRTTEIVSADSGPGGVSYLIPRLASNLLSLNVKHISGYAGARPIMLAMEQGEADASAFSLQSWVATVPHWFEKGKEFAVPVLQAGFTRDPDLPDVPMLTEIVDRGDRGLASFIATVGIIGRGLALPPGVSSEYVDVARAAFAKMLTDEAYLADAKKRNLRIDPVSSADLTKAVMDAFQGADAATVERARKILFADQRS